MLENLYDLELGKEFLDMSQKTCSIKKIGKSDFIKIENFLICNDSIKRIKRQATD